MLASLAGDHVCLNTVQKEVIYTFMYALGYYLFDMVVLLVHVNKANPIMVQNVIHHI